MVKNGNIFDEKINRHDTYSIKYDFNRIKGITDSRDVLPMWVADMDFRSPYAITEAMIEEAKRGVYGYSEPNPAYYQVIADWQKAHFGYEVDSSQICYTPGVVVALYIAVRAFSEPGDHILLQEPLYSPFKQAVLDNERVPVVNQLVPKTLGKHKIYEIDLADFEQKIIANDVKLFMLCSPHNPGGVVWSEEDLKKMGEICLRHGVKIVADEIHQDFVFAGQKHKVFATLSEEISANSIILTSSAKTFNLAGLQMSNIFIKNPGLKKRFTKEYAKTGLSQPPLIGIIASKAAYEFGEPWRRDLLDYLSENIDVAESFVENSDILRKKLVFYKKQGTYLSWIDFSALGVEDDFFYKKLLTVGKVWVSLGKQFGAGGEKHFRLNIGTNRANVLDAMERIERTVAEII